jgi:hypothetical protein
MNFIKSRNSTTCLETSPDSKTDEKHNGTVCVCERERGSIYVCVCGYLCIYIYACIYVHVYIYICMCE